MPSEVTYPALEILYEDAHCIAVRKPAGVLSQGDASGSPSMLDAVRAHLGRSCPEGPGVYVGLVHRLDRPVEGVMILAKTPAAAAALNAQFREHDLEKVYEAVVEGRPEHPEGAFFDHLVKPRQGKPVRVSEASDPRSREAVLEYQLEAHEAGFSLLSIFLVTGRSHQVRVQLASRGLPVLGDVKYQSRYRLEARRIALRAASLRLRHPATGKPLSIEASRPGWWPWPVPSGLRRGVGIRRG